MVNQLSKINFRNNYFISCDIFISKQLIQLRRKIFKGFFLFPIRRFRIYIHSIRFLLVDLWADARIIRICVIWLLFKQGWKAFQPLFLLFARKKAPLLRLILKRSALKIFGTGTYALLYTVICYDVPSSDFLLHKCCKSGVTAKISLDLL